jgi:hypothetical protein
MPSMSGNTKLQRAIKQFSLLILIFSLQGCSTLGNLTGKGTPVPQIPTLESAINFEKGISQIPKGYYIFIEFSGSSVCSDECNCAPGPVKPQYQFTSSGELVTDQPDIIPALPTPIVGFFGDGGISGGDRLYVIDKLPYKPFPEGMFTIYSIDAQGIATVGIGDRTYFIRPGQAWTDNGDVKQEPPAGCHMTYSSRLSNYGLLPAAKIRFLSQLSW